MAFIVKETGVHVVELEQEVADVNILVDGEIVAFFDGDEKDFVVFQNEIADLELTVSVEDSVPKA